MHICMFMGVGRMIVRVNITQVLGNPENVCYVCLWALVGWGLVLIFPSYIISKLQFTSVLYYCQ